MVSQPVKSMGYGVKRTRLASVPGGTKGTFNENGAKYRVGTACWIPFVMRLYTTRQLFVKL